MKIYSLIIVIIFIFPFVSSTCSVVFDRYNYAPTETILSTILCDAGNEEGQVYNLTWRNSTGDIVETDVGVAPATAGTSFFETYLVPSGYFGEINATLTGTNLEGNDDANVSGADADSLIISNITTSNNIRLGKTVGFQFFLKDENAKLISGAQCIVDIQDGNFFPIVESYLLTYTGEGHVSFELNADSFKEDTGYKLEIHCFCGASPNGCVDEDGTEITQSSGTGLDTFTTLKWLDVNTVTDKSSYSLGDEMFVCANVTNIDYDKRIILKEYYQIRCSADEDLSSDTDRGLIYADEGDERGIDSNTTKMQCRRIKISEKIPYLQGRNSECYASSSVWILDENKNQIVGYFTTSSLFNVTGSALIISPHWNRVSDNNFNTVINFSSNYYDEYARSGTGTIKIALSNSNDFSTNPYEQDFIPTPKISDFIALENIKNVTVRDVNGTIISSYLYFHNDGEVHIQFSNVDISSSAYYNLTIEFNGFSERQTEALEGIENKTGTFHLDVDCPTFGPIGSEVNCSITAQIEDPQLVQKEVDFTCGIYDGVNTYSSVNFNQMVTRSPITLYRGFLVPSNFNLSSYVLQCYADYYNLGSRRDSFYDTFTVVAASVTYSGASSGGGGGSIITGMASGIFDEQEGSGDKNTSSGSDEGGSGGSDFGGLEKGSNIYIYLGILILASLGVFSFVSVRNKIGGPNAFFASIFIVIIIGFIFSASLLFGVSKNSSALNSKVDSEGGSSFWETSLFRGVFLTLFISVTIGILFKLLNIRGEVKFGEDDSVLKRYRDQLSNQERINKKILRSELRNKRSLKKLYSRIRKI